MRVYKRYLVFEWSDGQDIGGLDQVKKDFDNKQDAIDYLREDVYTDYGEIFDRVEGVSFTA